MTHADTPPGFTDILAAAARIAPHAHATPVLRSRALDAIAGCELHFKCENLQRAGAFKFRGACNAVFSLDEAALARGIVTQSSGNHGAAVALAGRLRGARVTVVAPRSTPKVKLAAIKGYGARVIAGQDTATLELLSASPGLDADSSSSVAVPWPAITRASLNGCTSSPPVSASTCAVAASRAACVVSQGTMRAP